MATVGEIISRIRGTLKMVNEDSFITDRYLYSLVMKYGTAVIFKNSTVENIFRNSGLFREIPCLELIEVNAVAACCIDIKTACVFKRSKYSLPKIMQLEDGPVIRAITTLDYSTRINKTEPSLYANMTKTNDFKHNKNKYYWIIDNYLYIPDVEWEGVRVQALFEESISHFFCNSETKCELEQNRVITIPEYAFATIEEYIRKEMAITVEIPTDGADDSRSSFR